MVSPTGTVLPSTVDQPPDRARSVSERPGATDRIFRMLARGGGIAVLLIMSAVGIFLTYRGLLALDVAGPSFFTENEWNPGLGGEFGVAALVPMTILIATVAIVIAVPLATGAALYISEYAPPRIQRPLINLVDLMAAVPSVVYGIWGLYFLQPHAVTVSRFLSTWFGWIPIFEVRNVDPRDPLFTLTDYTSSTFIAGMVVALMVVPIICSIMREVFSQAPPGEREGAYALGATRWGMIRSVVLPFGRGGMIGGTMLGLGRALGETIAVFLIISPVFDFNFRILEKGAISISALIALRFGEATELPLSALMAAGLTLFVMTMIVNFFASAIIQRTRSGAASEA